MPKLPLKKQNSPNLLYYIIIAAASFVVYINALSNEFVFDDESVVLGDQSITEISNIPKYFTAQEGFHKVIGRYYRPVVSTTYAIDYALWGLKPFGFHLTNIIIHVINSLLFFKLLLLIFAGGKGNLTGAKLFAVLFGGLIFAVHPIHTEAVTWVSGRTDSLSFTFFTSSFIYYIKYLREQKVYFLVLLLLFYVLALLSKEMAITLPVVLILFDIAENKGLSVKLIKERFSVYFILFAASVLYLSLRWFILKDIPQRETYFYFYGKDAFTSLLTMLQTLPLYFRLLIVPIGLLYHYNGYLPYVNSITAPDVIIALVFIIVMAAITAYFFRKSPLISFSILLFFAALLPVMNIVPTMNFMAERFLYIPSISLSIVIAVVFIKYYNNKTKPVLISLIFIILGLLFLSNIFQEL